MNPRDKLRKGLISSHQAVLDLVESIDEDTARALRANEGWSGQDMLAHLAASELGHCEVIRLLLADEPTLIPDFDLDTFNNAEVAKRSQHDVGGYCCRIQGQSYGHAGAARYNP